MVQLNGGKQLTKTNNMYLKNLSLIVKGLLLASCSNDSDFFPTIDNNCSWETSIDGLITDNKSLFDSRGIRIVGFERKKDIQVNRDLFYGGEYGFFPVYSPQDSVYKIVKYEELVKNAKEYGFNPQKSLNKIDSLLNNKDNYEVVELTWCCGNDLFSSLALFNKLTGELEYDNMLFNMSTISTYNKNGFSMMLSIFEVSKVVDDADYVEHKVGDVLISKAGVRWEVYGSWKHDIVVLRENEQYIYLHDYAFFSLDHVDLSEIKHGNYDGGNYFIRKGNYSSLYSQYYNIRYAIWAGPNGGFNGTGFNLIEPESTFNSRFNANEGQGKIVEINERIEPIDEYRYIYF